MDVDGYIASSCSDHSSDRARSRSIEKRTCEETDSPHVEREKPIASPLSIRLSLLFLFFAFLPTAPSAPFIFSSSVFQWLSFFLPPLGTAVSAVLPELPTRTRPGLLWLSRRRRRSRVASRRGRSSSLLLRAYQRL